MDSDLDLGNLDELLRGASSGVRAPVRAPGKVRVPNGKSPRVAARPPPPQSSGESDDDDDDDDNSSSDSSSNSSSSSFQKVRDDRNSKAAVASQKQKLAELIDKMRIEDVEKTRERLQKLVANKKISQAEADKRFKAQTEGRTYSIKCMLKCHKDNNAVRLLLSGDDEVAICAKCAPTAEKGDRNVRRFLAALDKVKAEKKRARDAEPKAPKAPKAPVQKKSKPVA
jgi:hypothetical protein